MFQFPDPKVKIVYYSEASVQCPGNICVSSTAFVSANALTRSELCTHIYWTFFSFVHGKQLRRVYWHSTGHWDSVKPVVSRLKCNVKLSHSRACTRTHIYKRKKKRAHVAPLRQYLSMCRATWKSGEYGGGDCRSPRQHLWLNQFDLCTRHAYFPPSSHFCSPCPARQQSPMSQGARRPVAFNGTLTLSHSQLV